jgi:DMSO/TMAO reductase YedYZ molybdopterin-dependent catalytic subunit
VILDEAQPNDGCDTILVSASDGYTAYFDLSDVMADDELIVINEDGEFRIIAANYEGGYWVQMVVSIEVS